MPIDISRLSQVLELEGKKGYDNTVVFGGLDRFLANWANNNLPQLSSPAELKRLHKLWPKGFSYASLSPEERQNWSKALLALLAGTPAPAAKKPAPVRTPVPRKPAIKRPEVASLSANDLAAPITAIKGISATLASRFGKLGVSTIRDLLFYFPKIGRASCRERVCQYV
jgi:hypothetical protein